MTTVNLQEMLDQYKNEEVAVLPDGEYTLEVTKCSVKDIKDGEGLMPIYKVVGGPHAGQTAMLGTISLTPKSANIFFRTMKGFGLDKDFFATVQGLKEVAPVLVGRVIKAEVNSRPWKGEDRNQFAGIGTLELVAVGASDPSLPTAPAATAEQPAAPQPPAPPAPAEPPAPPVAAAPPAPATPPAPTQQAAEPAATSEGAQAPPPPPAPDGSAAKTPF
jgi:hypothetical protein